MGGCVSSGYTPIEHPSSFLLTQPYGIQSRSVRLPCTVSQLPDNGYDSGRMFC